MTRKTNAARRIETGESTPRETAQASGHGEKLTRRAQAAIVALLSHPTIPEAARVCGVSETTLWRWLQQDDFREKYKEAQNRVFDGALASLQGSATAAVDCLRRNLKCKNPSAQVQAARTILSYSFRAHETFELQTRIAYLEAALKAREEAEKNGFDENEAAQ